jgi:hypothetical protein
MCFLLRREMSRTGPSRHFAAAKQLGRFRGEADMEGCAARTGLVAFDPTRKLGRVALALFNGRYLVGREERHKLLIVSRFFGGWSI